MLEIINVYKQYDSDAESGIDFVLRDINWQVARGESVAITGPSGSGKSTLLNLIGGLDLPTRGSVILDGQDITAMNEKELAYLRNTKIGYIFQLHHLLPQCTVLENVLIPTLITSDQNKAELKSRARTLLERVGLSHRLDHRPGQLSGGERGRAAVVRALINRPKLLLADEPTGALDKKASDSLTDLLVELNREQEVTLIVATHSLELAHKMGRTWQLDDGMLTQAD